MVITGTSREDLNGRTGVATSFDHSGDRYEVELDENAGKKGKGNLKLKPLNLNLMGRKGKKQQRE